MWQVNQGWGRRWLCHSGDGGQLLRGRSWWCWKNQKGGDGGRGSSGTPKKGGVEEGFILCLSGGTRRGLIPSIRGGRP